jgi:hypothetical protein
VNIENKLDVTANISIYKTTTKFILVPCRRSESSGLLEDACPVLTIPIDDENLLAESIEKCLGNIKGKNIYFDEKELKSIYSQTAKHNDIYLELRWHDNNSVFIAPMEKVKRGKWVINSENAINIDSGSIEEVARKANAFQFK